MKLAAISGVNGVFTDEDIAKVTRLALEARKKQADMEVAPAAEKCQNSSENTPETSTNDNSPQNDDN